MNELEIQPFPLWDKLKAKRVPLSFDLELTPRCNLDCRHCYINLPGGRRRGPGQEVTVAEICAIAEQAVELGALWCLITGGEPLLRADFRGDLPDPQAQGAAGLGLHQRDARSTRSTSRSSRAIRPATSR